MNDQVLIISKINYLLIFFDVNWGSSTQANSYRHALVGLQKLQRMEGNICTFC
jgi:hypothetical protein